MNRPLHLLIPALNEALNLPGLVRGLAPVLEQLERPWRLLFVDDGSTDDTVQVIRELATRFPIEVVSHATNLGPGAAFTTGFRYLLEEAHDDDPIVTLEADTTSDVRLLPRMLERYDAGADLVLASPYHPQGGMRHTPLNRRVLSAGANLLMQTAFRLHGIHTLSSFYRVYRAGLLREALDRYGAQLMEEPGFAAVVELLIKLHRAGARIDEVPMVLDSAKRVGASRMRVARTIRAYLRLLMRLGLEQPPPGRARTAQG